MRGVAGIVPVVLAAGLATLFVWTGTHDLECYENAFYSLNRGTSATVVSSFGQPVYTLSIGLGTRLPLHGTLGASPAAALARVLPDPATHWLLLTLSMAAAALLVVYALQPLGGPLVAWGSILTLFWSLPMVAYTVFNDWPETAVTYCALVGGIFAPHALVMAGARRGATARWTRPSLLAITFSLLATAHPGYWPQLAGAVGLSSLLLFVRPVDRGPDRWTALAAMAVVGALAFSIHLPDLAREQALGAGLARVTQGASEFLLLESNSFPWASTEPRKPFTMMAVALVAILAVCATGRRWWPFVWATAALSLAFGAAAMLPKAPSLAIGSFDASPSAVWTLRDPAIVFAVMSGAFVCAALVGGDRAASTDSVSLARGPAAVRWTGLAVLALCAAQGMSYASTLLRQVPPAAATPWNHDWSPQATRVSRRGMPVNADSPGGRIALWPGVRFNMRQLALPSTDWADAGYPLVTAWTKNRTMAGLVRPNDDLFDQTTDLSSQVLCDPVAASFLRLRYLVLPDGQSCDGWAVQHGARIDQRWTLARLARIDAHAFAVRLSDLTPDERSAPALEGNLRFVSQLAPLAGSSLNFAGGRLSVNLGESPRDRDLALVLPVAYDPAWSASSGRTANLAGLLAIEDAAAPRVEVTFVPDAPLRIRALGMLAAQAAGAIGIALASILAGADNRAVARRKRWG